MKNQTMTFEEFKMWVAAAKELGVKIVFGPGSKAPEKFQRYAENEFSTLSPNPERNLRRTKKIGGSQ